MERPRFSRMVGSREIRSLARPCQNGQLGLWLEELELESLDW